MPAPACARSVAAMKPFVYFAATLASRPTTAHPSQRSKFQRLAPWGGRVPTPKQEQMRNR